MDRGAEYNLVTTAELVVITLITCYSLRSLPFLRIEILKKINPSYLKSSFQPKRKP